MRDWLEMKWAHLQDAIAIWDGSPQPNKHIFWFKVKASICIALNREARPYDFYSEMVPVWASGQSVHYSYDGPGCSWQEVAVDYRPTHWKFTRYENGF